MGPLNKVKVIELAGIGPTPFAGMMLSDMGAEVTRIDRISSSGSPVESYGGPMDRGKKSIAIDLKSEKGKKVALEIIATADVLVEGFRAGVAEKLGIGPEVCLELNPKLIYGRMTGWGQTGPLAQSAGHDINYISLAGPLAHIGRKGAAPTVPLNLIGDFGGGSIFLVLGICSALFDVARGGSGQVVDAAMVDGAAYLMSPLYAAYASNSWTDERGNNMLDSGAHFYDVYETADGKHIAVGSIEPQFYDLLIKGLGLEDEGFPMEISSYMDKKVWEKLKTRIGEVVLTKTRDEWAEIFYQTDACITPVLTMGEAPNHPQAIERNAYFTYGESTILPAPAPRWSKTSSEPAKDASKPGADTDAILGELNYLEDDIEQLKQQKVIA